MFKKAKSAVFSSLTKLSAQPIKFSLKIEVISLTLPESSVLSVSGSENRIAYISLIRGDKVTTTRELPLPDPKNGNISIRLNETFSIKNTFYRDSAGKYQSKDAQMLVKLRSKDLSRRECDIVIASVTVDLVDWTSSDSSTLLQTLILKGINDQNGQIQLCVSCRKVTDVKDVGSDSSSTTGATDKFFVQNGFAMSPDSHATFVDQTFPTLSSTKKAIVTEEFVDYDSRSSGGMSVDDFPDSASTTDTSIEKSNKKAEHGLSFSKKISLPHSTAMHQIALKDEELVSLRLMNSSTLDRAVTAEHRLEEVSSELRIVRAELSTSMDRVTQLTATLRGAEQKQKDTSSSERESQLQAKLEACEARLNFVTAKTKFKNDSSSVAVKEEEISSLNAKIESLNKKLAEVLREKESVATSYAESVQSLETRDRQVSELRDELSVMCQELYSCRREKSELKLSLETAQASREEDKRALEDKDKTMRQLRAELSDLSSRLAESQRELTEFGSQTDTKQKFYANEMSLLEQEIQNLKSQCAALKSSLSDEETSSGLVRSELSECESERHKLLELVSDLRQNIIAKDVAIADLQSESHNRNRAESQRTVDTLSGLVADLREELNSMGTQLSDREREIEGLCGCRDELRVQIEAISLELRDKSMQLRDLQGEVSQFVLEQREKQNQVEELQSKCVEMARIAADSGRAETLLHEEIQSIKRQLADREREIEILHLERTDLRNDMQRQAEGTKSKEDEYASLRSNLTQRNLEIENLKAEMLSLQQSLWEAERERGELTQCLHSSNEDATKEIEEWERQARELLLENNNLSRQLAQATETRETLEQQSNAVERSAQDQTRGLTEAMAHIEELQSELEEQERLVDEQRGEINIIVGRLSESEKDRWHLNSSLEALQASRDDAIRSIETLKTALSDGSGEVRDLAMKVSMYERNNFDICEENNELRSQLESAISKAEIGSKQGAVNDRLTSEFYNLSMMFLALKKEKQTAESELVVLQTKHQELSRRLEEQTLELVSFKAQMRSGNDSLKSDEGLQHQVQSLTARLTKLMKQNRILSQERLAALNETATLKASLDEFRLTAELNFRKAAYAGHSNSTDIEKFRSDASVGVGGDDSGSFISALSDVSSSPSSSVIGDPLPDENSGMEIYQTFGIAFSKDVASVSSRQRFATHSEKYGDVTMLGLKAHCSNLERQQRIQEQLIKDLQFQLSAKDDNAMNEKKFLTTEFQDVMSRSSKEIVALRQEVQAHQVEKETLVQEYVAVVSTLAKLERELRQCRADRSAAEDDQRSVSTLSSDHTDSGLLEELISTKLRYATLAMECDQQRAKASALERSVQKFEEQVALVASVQDRQRPDRHEGNTVLVPFKST